MTETSVRILARDLDFPEGPAFDSAGDLWCVELKGGHLVRLGPEGAERFAAGGAPNGLTFDAEGLAWFCDSGHNAVRRFDPRTSEWETIAERVGGEPLNKPNDLAFDARGNLVFTCPGNSRQEPTGYVCCRRADGSTEKIADGLFFPNGLAFVDDGRALVVAETYRQRLWKGGWDAEGALWIEPRPWAHQLGGPSGPDGMALGADGLLYVAVYGTGSVKAVNAEGTVVRTYTLPGNNPTNVAFDPADRSRLVVTEAEHGRLLSLRIENLQRV